MTRSWPVEEWMMLEDACRRNSSYGFFLSICHVPGILCALPHLLQSQQIHERRTISVPICHYEETETQES